MTEHKMTVVWDRGGALFTDNRYSRAHRWLFDGGLEVPASSSPQIIAPPLSMEAAVDPEEAFVASLASCHMLWFLAIAAKGGWVVEDYRDQAAGKMAPDVAGRMAMTHVTLRPQVRFGGERQPTKEEVAAMHHESHERCYLANSVKTDVRCELD